MKNSWLVLPFVLALSACSTHRHTLAERTQVAANTVNRVPYQIAVQFTSDLPDSYSVMSGPIESYRRVRVNDVFRRRLSDYAQKKSSSSGENVAEVHVHLKDLTTTFLQTGALELPMFRDVVALSFRPKDIFRGRHVTRTSARLASEPWVLARREADGDTHIPLEIHKSANLTIALQIIAAGETLRKETFSAEASSLVTPSEYDRLAYDYTGVIESAIRVALSTIDGIIDEALAGRGVARERGDVSSHDGSGTAAGPLREERFPPAALGVKDRSRGPTESA